MKSLVKFVALIAALLVPCAVLANPPVAPQNLQQAWLITESLLLWDDVPGATSYNVYRADETNTAWALVASGLMVPRWRDEGWELLPSHYFVTAVNADGEGAPSDSTTVLVAWGYTISITPLSAWWYGNVTPTNATVNWATSNSDGDQGIVEWGAAETNGTNFAFFIMNTNYLPWHTFVLTNLAPATFYHYRVTSIASNRGGVSVISSFATPDTNHAPAVLGEIFYGNGVLFSVTDTDQPPQTIAYEFIAPTNGTVSGPFSQGVNVWGVLYTPNPGARGLDSMTFVAHDGVESSVPCVITFSNWLNRLPEAGWGSTNIIEDTPTVIALPSFDPDGDPVTFDILWVDGGSVSGTPPNLVFTPAANSTFSGEIYYLANDGYGSNYGSVQIFITPVNDRPVAQSQSVLTSEDVPALINPAFTDVEGGSFSVSIVRGPTSGVLSGQNFDLQYVPAANFHGFDSFDFAIVEPDGTTSDPATVTIEVVSINDSPTVPAQTVTTREETAVSFTLNASDADGDTLTFWINSGPAHGTLSGTLPNLTYTPEPGFFGSDTFNYSAYDGFDSRPNNVTLGVGVNSLPQVEGLRRRTFYPDGIVRLWWNAVPGAPYYNVYRADGTNAPFTLLASNIAPTNFNDATAQWQQPYFYRVRAWDGTNEGQPSGTVFAQPDSTGALTLNQPLWMIRGTTGLVQFVSSLVDGVEGSFEYGTNRSYGVLLENTNLLPLQRFALSNLTPATAYYFRIIATDVRGNAIEVSTNYYQDWFTTETWPLATAQSASTSEDNALNITLAGVEPNSTFHPLTYSLVSGVAHGTLTATGPNTYRYLPVTNYNGADSFTFMVNNGELNSTPAAVSINVTAVNDLPVAANISATVAEDVSSTIPAQFTDVDGGTFSLQIVTAPTHGFAGISGTNLLYFSATNYFGPDNFTYRVTDGYGVGNTATVSIAVTNVNDAPVATNVSFLMPEDTTFVLSPTMVAMDVEGSPLSLQVMISPSHGTLSASGTNLLYRPATNYSGPDFFNARVTDGSLASAVVLISMSVQPVNDRPVANAQSLSTAEDTARAITLTGSDVDGNALTYTVATSPAHGTLTGSGQARTYTPTLNYNGPDSFTFYVNDGSTNSATATVSITVTALNDAPVANPLTVTLNENSATNFVLSATDVDSGSLNYAALAGPAHGTLSGTAPNLTYTPDANYNGVDSVQFSVSDGALSGTNVVSIVVLAVNYEPVASPQFVSVNEDGARAITLTASDSDGDAITYSVVNSPAHGALSGSGPNLTYTPATNFNGADNFTFRASDGATSSIAVVSIMVTPENDAPVANPQSLFTDEDSALAVALTGSDPDGDALSFVIVTAPTHGTLSGTAPNLTYTPAADFNGPDSFSFKASDGQMDGNTASISITVQAVNDAPVSTNQLATTLEDTALTLAPAGADVDGDMLTFLLTTPRPAHGTVSIDGTNFVYAPDANYTGTDVFSYAVTDGSLTSAVTTVTVTIQAVNDAPIATAQSLTTAEDTALNLTLAGSDVDGDTLSFTVVNTPTHGTLTGTVPNLTYAPTANYNGVDSITFKANDGNLDSATVTISFTVTAVNDAPVANAPSLTTAEDTALAITLGGSDVENSALTYIVVTGPAHGTLTGSGNTRTYTPASHFNGADSFTFKVNDGAADSPTATVTLSVTPVNDTPLANAQSVNTQEDTAVAITLTGTDVETAALAYTVLTLPTHGTLSSTNAQTVTYTPVANYHGPDSFVFRVSDGTNTSPATVSITISAVNDAPVANAQSVTVIYNTAKSVTLIGTDLEGSALTYTVVSGPTNGTLSGTAPNLTYTPNTGSAGADRFTFRVNDGGSNSAPATVSITTLNPVAISTAPTALTVTVPTATGTLILNWSCTATNEDGFKIERSLNGSSGWSQIATTGINIHTFTNTGLTSNTRYYYRVRSYNLLGNSAYSGTVNARAR